MSFDGMNNIAIECEVDRVLHSGASSQKVADKSAEYWTVFLGYIKEGSNYQSRVCVGMAPVLEVGESVTLTGHYVEDPKWGYQFKFDGIQKKLPSDDMALVDFFTRNVNGVGPSIARNIVMALRPNVIEKIEDDYTCLLNVSGISEKRAVSISNQLMVMHSSIDELTFFAQAGLGAARIALIKKYFSEEAKRTNRRIDIIETIKNNPYILVDCVKGIGFKLADSVALRIGFAEDDPKRIGAALKYSLQEEVDTKGNIWTTEDDLIKSTAGPKFLNIDRLKVRDVLVDSINNGNLIKEDDRVYIPYYYRLEIESADKIKEMLDYSSKSRHSVDVENAISTAENVKGRELDDEQREAVRLCIENNVSIMTGGPGVGKTTTLDILLHILETDYNMKTTLAAPTGRAAKRMSEQTGRLASTIHSLSLNANRDDFVEGDQRSVIVVDESSMIDASILKMVLDLCDVSTKLIFVGDIDQLPSIGPGQILSDMIDSGIVPTARLKTIHRQAGDSNIIINSHALINGQHLIEKNRRDFFVREKETEEECLKSLLTFYTKTYPSNGFDISDIQILAPLKRGLLGVTNLNNMIQQTVNPAGSGKKEVVVKSGEFEAVYREGDRVIQTKNNYNLSCLNSCDGVFNGEIGSIKKIENDDGLTNIYVEFIDGKIGVYDMDSVKELSLAYAITVHKSQGSEFKVVIIPLYNFGIPTIFNRNLLYTAVTRAKESCCIIGREKEAVNKMIHNAKVNNRRTTFAARLSGNIEDSIIKKKKTTRKKKKA